MSKRNGGLFASNSQAPTLGLAHAIADRYLRGPHGEVNGRGTSSPAPSLGLGDGPFDMSSISGSPSLGGLSDPFDGSPSLGISGTGPFEMPKEEGSSMDGGDWASGSESVGSGQMAHAYGFASQTRGSFGGLTRDYTTRRSGWRR